jgi:hypothetical protein
MYKNPVALSDISDFMKKHMRGKSAEHRAPGGSYVNIHGNSDEATGRDIPYFGIGSHRIAGIGNPITLSKSPDVNPGCCHYAAPLKARYGWGRGLRIKA